MQKTYGERDLQYFKQRGESNFKELIVFAPFFPTLVCESATTLRLNTNPYQESKLGNTRWLTIILWTPYFDYLYEGGTTSTNIIKCKLTSKRRWHLLLLLVLFGMLKVLFTCSLSLLLNNAKEIAPTLVTCFPNTMGTHHISILLNQLHNIQPHLC